MTNGEIYNKFRLNYPDLDVDDYRPISDFLTDNRQGITVFLKNGDILVYYPQTENNVEHSEHWIKKGMYEYQCGSCGMIIIGDVELDLESYRYCPRCGKKKTHIFISSETI